MMSKLKHNASPQHNSEQDVAVLQRRIRVALGEQPADLLLEGGRVVNVFTQQIEEANVAIADGWIAGVGPYDWQARERVSLDDGYLLPGLIDAHMHVESTMLMPAELARLVVPNGTSTIIADPHEMANVMGEGGIEQMLRASENLPLDIFFMAPSCVPATSWEDSGATLDAAAIGRLLQHKRVLGLAEVMDQPSVWQCQPEMLAKIATAHRNSSSVDGHAPGTTGLPLVAYAAAGIRSDHESSEPEEALAKASLGMMVQVREGSSARNLEALLPLLVADRLGDWCLATDDIEPGDLLSRGHINSLLERVVAAGVPLPRAVRHVTLVPARHYGFADRGAVAPGYRADLLVTQPSDLRPRLTIHEGAIVARNGEYRYESAPPSISQDNSIHLAAISAEDFRLRVDGPTCPVIGIVPDQIVTKFETREVRCENGHWVFDPQDDVVLVASVERHRATGRIGLGLVRGFGLQRGAIGSSVAHDSHNLIVAGTNARDMLTCVRAMEQMGGGLVAADDGNVLASFPLPVAGLLATSSAETACRDLDRMAEAAANLGGRLSRPFGTLSFLALPVIPELRITARGLFDVRRGEFVA